MAKLKKESISETVYSIIKDDVCNLGYDIWDVDYRKEGSEYDLEVIIENKDRSKPIGLDDCQKVSQLISPILDREDPIAESYYLEVSSAGIERELKKPEHFEFCKGWKLCVFLFAAIDGKKKLEGILDSYDGANIGIKTENGEIIIEKGKYSKIIASIE